MSTDFTKAFEQADTYKYSDTGFYDGGPIHGTKSSPGSKISDNAVVVDDWHRRKGEELAEKLNVLPEAADKLTDFHAVLFENTYQLEEKTTAEKRAKFIAEFTNTTDFEELHVSTQYDSFASFIGTRTMLQKYAELPADASEKEIKNQAKNALDAANETVGEAEEIQNALGESGTEAGTHEGSDGAVDIKKRLQVFEQIKHNNQLRKIMEQAGRFRRAAQSMQRQRTTRGNSEIGDIGLGGNVRRLTASERMRLGCGVPEIEDMTALKVLGKTALERKRIAPEPLGRGPIIVLCDESGSMGDNRIVYAKAMCLALAWIAKNQDRPFALCGFRNSGRWEVFEPRKVDQKRLLKWLAVPNNGGTSSRALIWETVERWETFDWKEKADIITITDGCFDISTQEAEAWNEWREERQIKHQAIAIGQYAGNLGSVADSLDFVDELDVGDGSNKVENIFRNV